MPQFVCRYAQQLRAVDFFAKFSGAFDSIFRSERVEIIRLPYRASPRPLGGLIHEYSRRAA
jgi:hypothetical protein